MFSSKIFTLLCFFLGNQASNAQWGYEPSNGPATWCNSFPTCCPNVPNQSPIQIITFLTHPYPHDIIYRNYNVVPDSMKLENTGATVDLFLESNSMPSISGGRLGSDSYTYEQLHFHWGSTSSQGAEHHIDLRVYPMEMHIVHYNRALYNNFDEARRGEAFGVAVIGVFFKISAQDNSNFNEIVNNLNDIRYREQNTSIDPFQIQNLLPKNNAHVYYYNGSLTTPPCNGNVRWILLEKPVEISEAQIRKFRSLFATEENSVDEIPLVNNFRPLQKLGKRRIDRARDV